MRIKKNSLFILLLILLGACVEQVPYSNYQLIRGGKWEKDHLVSFDMDSLDVDHGAPYEVQLSVMHSNRYAYRNLTLVVEHNLIDTTLVADTLHLTLADEHGKWLGNGAAGLYQYDIVLRQHLLLDSTRNYRVIVGHDMRDNPLRGVERVGVTIDRK